MTSLKMALEPWAACFIAHLLNEMTQSRVGHDLYHLDSGDKGAAT